MKFKQTFEHTFILDDLSIGDIISIGKISREFSESQQQGKPIQMADLMDWFQIMDKYYQGDLLELPVSEIEPAITAFSRAYSKHWLSNDLSSIWIEWGNDEK